MVGCTSVAPAGGPSPLPDPSALDSAVVGVCRLVRHCSAAVSFLCILAPRLENSPSLLSLLRGLGSPGSLPTAVAQCP